MFACLHKVQNRRKSNTLHYISWRWHQYYISLEGDKYTFTFEYLKIRAALVVKQMNILPESSGNPLSKSLKASCSNWRAELRVIDNTHREDVNGPVIKWVLHWMLKGNPAGNFNVNIADFGAQSESAAQTPVQHSIWPFIYYDGACFHRTSQSLMLPSGGALRAGSKDH